jgi:hypothetical protein
VACEESIVWVFYSGTERVQDQLSK